MMYVRRQLGRLCLGLCLLALASVQVAHAQSTDRVSAAEFGRLWGPALSSNATQVRNFPSGPSYNVTSAPSVTAESGGALAVSKSARFPVGDSRVIDVVAKAPVSKAAMGKVFKLAVAASGGYVGLGLFAAAEIADWMAQSGLRQDPANPAAIQRKDPAVCTVAPCYEYQIFYGRPWFVDITAACIDGATSSGRTFVSVSGSAPSYSCNYTNYVSTVPAASRSTSPATTPSWLPASPAQIETAAATPTMKPEWLTRILDTGLAIDAGDSSLTGPATLTGPSSSSSQAIKDSAGNTTGTKTVNTSSVYNITYNGNTYNVNQVTTVTTVNPDGTSTVETKTDAKTPDNPTQSDCDKVPDSAGCVSLGSPTSDPLNKKTQAVAVVAATFASASGCPSPLSFSVRSLSYSFSYQPLCDRLALLKLLFLAIAGVLAAYILADSFRVQ